MHCLQKISMARLAFLPPALVWALAACGPGQERPRTATAASAPAAAASAPVLLVAPEDVRTVSRAAVAGGPVILGSVQPERRADLRAEVAAVVCRC
jgi:membrane fusion protein (multidrug efflux system)